MRASPVIGEPLGGEGGVLATTKATKLLRLIRAALKESPGKAAHQVAIERALADCLSQIQKLEQSDEVFISRATAEQLLESLESIGNFYDDRHQQMIDRLRSQLVDCNA